MFSSRGDYIIDCARFLHSGGNKLKSQAHRQGQHPRLAVQTSTFNGAGAYICGEENARVARGQEGYAAHEAALSGGHGPRRQSNDGQQCRVHRRSADDPAPRRFLVYEFRCAQNAGTKLFAYRVTQQGLQRGRGDVDFVSRIDQTRPAASARLGEFLVVIPGGSSVRLCRRIRSSTVRWTSIYLPNCVRASEWRR